MKTYKLVIAAILIIVIGGLVIFSQKEKDNTIANEKTPQVTTKNSTAEPAAVITYADSGFSLSADRIKVGDTVKVTNSSGKDLSFASDPHPVHTDNSELNAGIIAPGQSSSFTIDKKGKWGFHNHLNDRHHGQITVE